MAAFKGMGWMDYTTTGPDVDGFVTLTAKPKRWYALRPSFWLFAVRHLRLRPYQAEPIEEEEA